ncbi:RNA ligase [Kitasatospora camelliae]|uniref:RNA ligase n=1 Tax=Kitasatospora camelliae TaxID=3156397 RepID=A0AAU8K6A0_9ACTN
MTDHLTLADLFDPADLDAALDAGYVTRKPHPTDRLEIYTYSATCQYGNIWTPVTTACRGLIVEKHTGRIIALPFPKIFVTGMHGTGHDFAPPLPTGEPFEVYEKADGSLAIVHFYDGTWRAASKGSFISEQAQWAQTVLDRSDLSGLDTGLTYLAEAIYPGNRIVVDYGTREDLVLLAAFRPADGSEVPLDIAAGHWKPIGTAVQSWGLYDDVTVLEKRAAASLDMHGSQVNGMQEEGYIIRYASGRRAKIKLSAYLTLHKLYTGTNERTVWEALASGQDLGTLFDRVPDEFRDWVDEIAMRLRAEHNALAGAAERDYTAAMDGLADVSDRKAFAMAASKSAYRPALFLFYDGRRDAVGQWVWRQLKPRADKPFKADEEG